MAAQSIQHQGAGTVHHIKINVELLVYPVLDIHRQACAEHTCRLRRNDILIAVNHQVQPGTMAFFIVRQKILQRRFRTVGHSRMQIGHGHVHILAHGYI